MTTIHLTASAAPTTDRSALDALPRRVALTLPELRLLAAEAGGAPLPFEARPTPEGLDPLESRLGLRRTGGGDEAYASALAALPDPSDSLSRRGLLPDGRADAALVGAVGLLATPEIALDLDVSAGGVQARAWHRQAGGAVATLATVDGLVFELAWFSSGQWADDLARVPVVPEEVTLTDSEVPAHLDLPYELVDAVGEALREGRDELVPVLVAHHTGAVHDGTGSVLTDAAVVAAVTQLHAETQGRLRGLVARVDRERTTEVGVVSWLLLADGWRALRAHGDAAAPRVEIRRVEPSDLAPTLAPVLAEVNR
ncbi:hypothetical protein [Nocardioides sp.]|uniref:hypothetical protein n=1 Tax=Nocardioides sp. TaxID=35761 RepID=UPI0027358AB8|nr:hypothetical protein [Nocardioides sp.]MDP3891258.1 hypothetical protein [Nocardioides sp.]